MSAITLEMAIADIREYGREPDVTDDRERYLGTPAASWFTPFVEPRWECTRRGEQYVYVNEAHRIIVIRSFREWVNGGPHVGWEQRGRIPQEHVEIWATVDGYEDRLDELVPVAVAHG